MSGLSEPLVSGPRLENDAVASLWSTAATARAEGAAAGLETVFGAGPSLPAAMTNSAPVSAVRRSTARLDGSSPLPGPLPRLMLITLAPVCAAHSMAPMTADVLPWPFLSSTLPTTSCAPGATPLYFPPEAAPLPTTVSATWVPWPLLSTTDAVSPSVVKLRDSTTLPLRSGWVASMPLSSTATFTPLPS